MAPTAKNYTARCFIFRWPYFTYISAFNNFLQRKWDRPNSTHVLQPLDVAVFRTVKGTWREIVREFRVKNNYAKLKRTDFSAEVQKCFDRSLKPETIKSGFKCCGLYPFDQKNIDYDKLLSKVKKCGDKVNQGQDSVLLHSQQLDNT